MRALGLVIQTRRISIIQTRRASSSHSETADLNLLGD
jgi:hypothetical protein